MSVWRGTVCPERFLTAFKPDVLGLYRSGRVLIWPRVAGLLLVDAKPLNITIHGRGGMKVVIWLVHLKWLPLVWVTDCKRCCGERPEGLFSLKE